MDFAYLRAKFWDEKLWLPEGVTWKTLESKDPNVLYPKASELYITPLIGLVLIVARYFFENYIADPIGRYMGVRSVQYKVVPNATLEGLYKKYGKSSIPHKEITGTAKQLDWTEMKVHRWLRKRRLQNAPTNMKKFRECSYQFVFYSISAVCGLVFMWDKSWFWETKQCWENWPYHPISSGTYWYYMIEMGFYFSLLFTCLMDSKRKDFYEMTLHHFMTLFLMGFSWSINFSHIGTLVLIVHDVSDPWMQIAKMTKYARMQNVCEVLFAIFAVLWILSRVVYYPLWLLNTCLVELPAAIKVSPVIAIFQGVMVLLQILHIIWTYYILRVVSQRFTHGELTHDTRSDSNSITESEEEVDGRPGGDNSNNCSNDLKKVN